MIRKITKMVDSDKYTVQMDNGKLYMLTLNMSYNYKEWSVDFKLDYSMSDGVDSIKVSQEIEDLYDNLYTRPELSTMLDDLYSKTYIKLLEERGNIVDKELHAEANKKITMLVEIADENTPRLNKMLEINE